MKNKSSALLRYILSMFIFGTIGIIRNYLPYPSSFVAWVRAFVGMLFLLSFLVILKKEKLDFSGMKGHTLPLVLSGIFLGFNWILLFESYRYTSVAVGTLCYYMAPVIMIVLSPYLFKESLNLRKILCVIASVCGMVIISGILQSGFTGAAEWKGILFGLSAAVLYAAIVILNKKTGNCLPGYEKTILQLGISSIALIPYILATEEVSSFTFSARSIILLLIVGILHTGIAYALYFGNIPNIQAQQAALFSYIDPVIAIILSAAILHEPMTPLNVLGSILILGGAILSN